MSPKIHRCGRHLVRYTKTPISFMEKGLKNGKNGRRLVANGDWERSFPLAYRQWRIHANGRHGGPPLHQGVCHTPLRLIPECIAEFGHNLPSVPSRHKDSSIKYTGGREGGSEPWATRRSPLPRPFFSTTLQLFLFSPTLFNSNTRWCGTHPQIRRSLPVFADTRR